MAGTLNINLFEDGAPQDDWDSEGHLGGDIKHDGWISGITGNIHEVPECVDLSAYLKRENLPVPARPKERGGDVRLLAIGCTFSVEAAGAALVRSVGARIRFRDDEEKLNKKILCRVIGLQPSPEFISVGEFGAVVEGQATMSTSAAIGFNPNVTGNDARFLCDPIYLLQKSLSVPKAEGAFDLSTNVGLSGKLVATHRFYRCRVSATGVGSFTANWQMYRDSETLPLTNRDLHVWTYLSFERNKKTLSFDVQLEVAAWCGLLPRRLFSRWERRTCRIPDELCQALPPAL